MDNNTTKTCTSCGRELPLETFRKNMHGYTSVCRECARKAYRKTCGAKEIETNRIDVLEAQLVDKRRTELSQFTPRELMVELRERGYRGTLEYTEIRIVDIDRL